jgi:membrane-associated protease RseP (regulator of RpoE activity)
MNEPSDFPPHQPSLPSNQPPRLPAPGHLIGVAEATTLRAESDPYVENRLITVLSFRLQVPGQPQPVEVDMRGISLTGTVRDGDWIEVPSQRDKAGVLAVSSANNLTTGLAVRIMGRGRPSGPRTVAAAVFLVVALVMLVMIVLAFGSVLR